MIAYHTHIKIIPELSTPRIHEASFSDQITVKKSNLTKKLLVLNNSISPIGNLQRGLRLSTDRDFALGVAGQPWAFEVEDVVTFFWNSTTSCICYSPSVFFTPSLFEYLLLHTFLPIYFTLEGKYQILHAGAVEIAGKPVLFTAQSYGGKSTLTDFFVKKGHTMLSDDKVATCEKNGQFLAFSSYPWHRPYRETEDLGYFTNNFATEAKPIHAIYALKQTDVDASIHITEIKGVKKFKYLHFSNDVNFHFLKAQHFIYLTKMAERVPLYRVEVPWLMGRLSEVHSEIVKHSMALQETAEQTLNR